MADEKPHSQIRNGLVLGLAYGVLAAGMGWGGFTGDWISPFATGHTFVRQ